MLTYVSLFLFIIVLFIAGYVLFVYSFTRRLIAVFLRGDAPFVPSKMEVLPRIVEAMDINENDIIYDLGCGDARVLVACYLKHPDAKYVGYENDFIPYLWTKYRLWRMGISKKIIIHKKDFFEADLSSATKIFTYLLSGQMKRLEKKFERELKEGARVVSLSFKLAEKNPLETIALDAKKRIYVYEFLR